MTTPDILRVAHDKFANYTHVPLWAAYDKQDGKWEVRVYNDHLAEGEALCRRYYFGPEDTRRARGIHRLVEGLLATLNVAHAPAT